MWVHHVSVYNRKVIGGTCGVYHVSVYGWVWVVK